MLLHQNKGDIYPIRINPPPPFQRGRACQGARQPRPLLLPALYTPLQSYPKRDPRKPFEEVSFFSASAISCIAFCSASAILQVDTLCTKMNPSSPQVTQLVCLSSIRDNIMSVIRNKIVLHRFTRSYKAIGDLIYQIRSYILPSLSCLYTVLTNRLCLCSSQ